MCPSQQSAHGLAVVDSRSITGRSEVFGVIRGNTQHDGCCCPRPFPSLNYREGRPSKLGGCFEMLQILGIGFHICQNSISRTSYTRQAHAQFPHLELSERKKGFRWPKKKTGFVPAASVTLLVSGFVSPQPPNQTFTMSGTAPSPLGGCHFFLPAQGRRSLPRLLPNFGQSTVG